MRRMVVRLTVMGVFSTCCVGSASCERYEPADGDIVFQISPSAQSEVIQIVTKSKYSHMGVVFIDEEGPVVYEAVGPVKATPLATWIARGREDQHVVVKRLVRNESELSRDEAKRLRETGRAMWDAPYDLCFGWSDARFYCSEYVWKVFHRALGVEVARLQSIAEFDLTHPKARDLMKARGCRFSESDTVISPAAIFDSGQLETVFVR